MVKVRERAHPSDLLWELLGFDEDPRTMSRRELRERMLAIAEEIRQEPERVAQALEGWVRDDRREDGECPDCGEPLELERRVRETRYGPLEVEVDACPLCGYAVERE